MNGEMKNQTFQTERLPLAIYLHADGRLRFLRCEPVSREQVAFVFDDPTSEGEHIEYEFDMGAKIKATAIFASQTFIRRQMTKALKENGKPKMEHTHEQTALPKS